MTLSKGASFRPHYALLHTPDFHQKWMAYIHDPYPFHYYPEPYRWSEPGFRKKIDFFKKVSDKCKWAAYPSLYLAEWMEEHFQSFRNKRVVIPHQLEDYNNMKNQMASFKNQFVILHAGNLMKQRSPETLVLSYENFLQRNPEARDHSSLIFMGNYSYHKELLKQYQQKIASLELYSNLPYKDALKMQNSASINVILEFKGEVSPFTSR